MTVRHGMNFKKYFKQIASTAISLFLLSSCATNPLQQTPVDTMTKPGEVSFCAAGDVMLDRGVKQRIVDNGLDYIFKKTGSFIKVRNISFCNLEGPVSTRGKRKNGGFAFRAEPDYLAAVKNTGFNLVSVGNNHMMDYGADALTDTLNYLDDRGIAYAGAGLNRAQARGFKIVEVNGVKIALIADLDMPFKVEEVPDDPEVPQMSERRGLEEMVKEIKLAKTQADFVVVSYHWGYEYVNYPITDQSLLARGCIDAGADLVLGHHPHVAQGVETYKGKPIIYSMGNLVFDQFREITSRTFFFACDFLKDGSIKNAFITPVLIVKNRPEFAKGKEGKRIRDRVIKLSKKFGTVFTEKDGRLYLKGF